MDAEGGVGRAPREGLYIASIVGLREAPKGVERKSVGRSVDKYIDLRRFTTSQFSPLMKSGIELPVKKPTTSFVNELQLKSGQETC